MSDFNNIDDNKENQEEMFSHAASSEKVIPGIVKAKEKKRSGKGKIIVLTTAVALASFGAGSLYTSYSWIQDKTEAIEKEQQVLTKPSTSVSQTSANTYQGNGMTVSQIANTASVSVVEITTESVQNDMFMRQYVSEGAGSGVVISKDGYIVTNNHVINGATKITVRLNNGKTYQGKLVGTDSHTDLAVIKIEGATLTPAIYGNSEELVVGDTAVAIGNPLGELGGTVTNGIISATDRQIELDNQTMTLLQTNAAINPGNSGGGLFNDKGELIGIVVAKSSGSNVEGLGFAIPVNVVKDVVQSIVEVGYVKGRPVLGINVLNVNSPELASYYNVNQQGVYIVGLTEGTKAASSGLKVGDCIIAVDDVQVTSTTELTSLLKTHKVGDTVKVMISREGKLLTLKVELSESVPEKTTPPSEEDKTTNENNLPEQRQNNQGQIPNSLFEYFMGGQ